jgi:AcrR family transcriptional regulator
VPADRGYHHGDLRAALIEASFGLLAEGGVQRFSVAAVARRLGVSSAAPYRHFPDRNHLLSAISAVAARDLRAAVLAAADAAGPVSAAPVSAAPAAAVPPASAADRLATVAGTYVRHVVRTGAGFPVIFAADLHPLPDDARRGHTRALMSTLLDLATATGAPSYRDAVTLVEAAIAVAHGYASLFTDGFFARTVVVDDIATRATEAARALIPPAE